MGPIQMHSILSVEPKNMNAVLPSGADLGDFASCCGNQKSEPAKRTDRYPIEDAVRASIEELNQQDTELVRVAEERFSVLCEQFDLRESSKM